MLAILAAQPALLTTRAILVLTVSPFDNSANRDKINGVDSDPEIPFSSASLSGVIVDVFTRHFYSLWYLSFKATLKGYGHRLQDFQN